MTELRLGGEGGGVHEHIHRHAQMHLGIAASVAIHPRDEETHKASDSDESEEHPTEQSGRKRGQPRSR